MKARLEFQAASEEQADQFLELLRHEAAGYLERTMELMQLSVEQMRHLIQTVGRVYAISIEGQLAGFYWIEEREKILHLHGIALLSGFQGQGIGTRVLNWLAEQFSGRVEAIELGVHESNSRAKALYERLGFRTIRVIRELKFSVLRKDLSGEKHELDRPTTPL
jgi:ribosomal protein S18 acetylase RimI-like enzyme